MARFAIIDAGRVTNIIEAEAAFASSIGAIAATSASIGDTWDGAQFISPTPDATAALQALRESMVVTPWQIRKALNATGLRDEVEAGVAAGDQTTKDAWQYATEFKRLDPLVVALVAGLGKTEAEGDAVFELALTL